MSFECLSGSAVRRPVIGLWSCPDFKEWRSPQDPDARVAKMKDGRTHLAHKVEHGVDLETGGSSSVVSKIGLTLNVCMIGLPHSIRPRRSPSAVRT